MVQRCENCKKKLTQREIKDNTGLCLRCEVERLRAYKRKEEEQLLKLVGSPTWRKVVEKLPIHGNGCVIHFW